jgi:hypothetical protein
VKRPFHVRTAFGAMAHHAFELAAGVGLVFQPHLRLGGAGAFWGTTLPGWAALSARGSSRHDGLLAFLAGMSAGAGVVHYTIWPVELRGRLPVLVAAEGLRSRDLPAYNAILYAWTLAATAALALETPSHTRRWAVPGFIVPFLLRPNIRHHFDWIRRQAVANPAWWNRALQVSG